MMSEVIRAIIFDCFGVLYIGNGLRDEQLLTFLRQLKDSYKIGVLSNTSRETFDRIFTPDEQRQYFDAVVVSGEVGVTKPNSEIFNLVCARLDVSTNEAVIVDDAEHYVAAAKQLGMQGIVYVNYKQCAAELGVLLAS